MKAASLKVRIIKARGLEGKAKDSTSDPYALLKLGSTKLKTKILTKTLSPQWDAEFRLEIQHQSMEESLSISVHHKDLFKSEFLGYFSLPISEIILQNQYDFDHPQNEPRWHPLLALTPKQVVLGDILVQFAFVGQLDPSVKEMLMNFHGTHNATLIASEDPADDLYFNHHFHMVDPEDETDTGFNAVAGSTDQFHAIPSVQYNVKTPTMMPHNDTIGILIIEILNARNLPDETWDRQLNEFNCDPFVVISFGTTTYRTKALRHTLNPDWNQNVYLHIKEADLVSDLSMHWKILDYEKYHKNNDICEARTDLKTYLQSYKNVKQNKFGPTVYPMLNHKIDMIPVNGQSVAKPTLNIRYHYVPCIELRRNFWFKLFFNYSYREPNKNELVIDKVALTTVLDLIESNFSPYTINQMFRNVNKKSDDLLTLSEICSILESSLDSAYYESEIEVERLTQMQKCPICKKAFDFRGDFDVVSHLGLCSHEYDTLDLLAKGGFLSAQSASIEWFAKVSRYVNFKGLNIGKKASSMIYQDRATGQLVKENIPTYVRLGIRLLYQVAGSRSHVEVNNIKRLLANLTKKQGEKFDSPSSKSYILPFIAYHNIDLDEVLEPLEAFPNFNSFSYRKLKPDARYLATPDPKVVVSPADARTVCFESIDIATEFWIKGTRFNLSSLLDDEILADRFNGASIAIFRLAPHDYHRIHIPIDGVIKSIKTIEGSHFTVNPMAIRTIVDVYSENVRAITVLESAIFGKVVYITVGAMLIGSIVITYFTH
ncbi:phosphatidylserine decarboxylase-domain-containing protein [Globomyces pollinis-pini]|nr:phosphatidylserine decarboxylase-domain-containing protein [Globomyces pollinis-pini]